MAIKVFTSENCPKCKMLKQIMDDFKISYEEVEATIENFSEDDKAVDIYKKGMMSLPVVVWEDDVLSYEEAVERVKQHGAQDTQ